MGAELGKAYVQIMPSAQGMGSKISGILNKEVPPAGESAGKLLGGKLGTAAVAGIAAAGTAATVALTKAALSEGAQLQQSIGGIETLFKDSASKVQKYASEAYKTVGVSSNQYMEQVTSFSASLLQSLGGDTAKAADVANMAMIDMGDNANKMGTSMQDIQNAYQGFAKQNYTMLDNLKLGYGGTKTEMERLLADAEKLSGKKYDISNLSDVYEAIHVIQGELGITGTTAEEAATTITGSMASLKAAFHNFLGGLALGEDVYPLIQQVGTAALTALKNIIPMVGTILKGIPQAILNHSGDIANGVSNLISSLLTHAPAFLAKVVSVAGTVLAGFVALIPTLLTGVWNGFTSAISTGIAAMGEVFRSKFESIKETVRTIFTSIKEKIMAPIRQAKETVSTIIDSIKQKFSFSGLIAAVQSVFNSVKNAIMNPINTAKTLVQNAINKIKSIFSGASFKLPHIKLPHFSISGKLSLTPPSVPRLSVNWYKKGGLFNSPSIIGVGEAGTEAVIPLSKLQPMLNEAMANAGGGGVYQFVIPVTIDGKQVAVATAKYMQNELNNVSARSMRMAGVLQ